MDGLLLPTVDEDSRAFWEGTLLGELRVIQCRFERCHVGHAYSPATLAEAQGEAFEQALWMALRTHNERIKLFTRMKESAESQGKSRTAAKWSEAMDEAQVHVDLLRTILTARPPSDGKSSQPKPE